MTGPVLVDFKVGLPDPEQLTEDQLVYAICQKMTAYQKFKKALVGKNYTRAVYLATWNFEADSLIKKAMEQSVRTSKQGLKGYFYSSLAKGLVESAIAHASANFLLDDQLYQNAPAHIQARVEAEMETPKP